MAHRGVYGMTITCEFTTPQCRAAVSEGPPPPTIIPYTQTSLGFMLKQAAYAILCEPRLPGSDPPGCLCKPRVPSIRPAHPHYPARPAVRGQGEHRGKPTPRTYIRRRSKNHCWTRGSITSMPPHGTINLRPAAAKKAMPRVSWPATAEPRTPTSACNPLCSKYWKCVTGLQPRNQQHLPAHAEGATTYVFKKKRKYECCKESSPPQQLQSPRHHRRFNPPQLAKPAPIVGDKKQSTCSPDHPAPAVAPQAQGVDEVRHRKPTVQTYRQ